MKKRAVGLAVDNGNARILQLEEALSAQREKYEALMRRLQDLEETRRA